MVSMNLKQWAEVQGVHYHTAYRWLQWARHSRLQPFVKLARTITRYRASIEAALRHRLSNALVETTDQKIRLIMRRYSGFHSAEAIIAMAKLCLGGLCPRLPDRS